MRRSGPTAPGRAATALAVTVLAWSATACGASGPAASTPAASASVTPATTDPATTTQPTTAQPTTDPATTAQPTTDPATTTQPTTDPVTTTPGPACPGDPSGGRSRATLATDAAPRSYLVATPDDTLPPARRLLVNLHGHGGSAEQHDRNSGMSDAATAAGIVVVTPDALNDPQRWNFGRDAALADDFAFLRALIDDALDRYCVGSGEVVVVGSSNGAAMAGLYACTDPRVVAVAMVIATVPSTCPPGWEMPTVLSIRGTADVTVPYEGAPDLVATWATAAGCDPAPTVTAVWPGVDRTAHAGCAGGITVALDTVRDGVHAWPGGVEPRRADDSEAGRTYPATGQVVDLVVGLA